MTVCSAGVPVCYQTCKQDIFNIRYVSPQTIAHHFSFAKKFRCIYVSLTTLFHIQRHFGGFHFQGSLGSHILLLVEYITIVSFRLHLILDQSNCIQLEIN